MSVINARTLMFGYFDGTTQYLHISNIKIIDVNDKDIAKSCFFQQSSVSELQSPGELKNILTDGDSTTFCHTKLDKNANITIDFGKTVTIKQIIVENRTSDDNTNISVIYDRLKNAEFRLFESKALGLVLGDLVYDSQQINEGHKYYYINTSLPNINYGLPPVIVVPEKPDYSGILIFLWIWFAISLIVVFAMIIYSPNGKRDLTRLFNT